MRDYKGDLFGTTATLLFMILVFCSSAYALLEVTPGQNLAGNPSSYICALSPEGAYAAMGGEGNNNIIIYDASTGTDVGNILLASGGSESIDMSLNGDYLVVGTQDSKVYCYDKTGTFKWSHDLGSGEIQVAITPDGAKVFAAALDTFYRIDVSTGILEKTTLIDDRGWAIWDISVSTAGDRVVLKTNSDVIITDQDGNELYFYDIVTGNYMHSADISPDGTQFAVTYRNSSNVFYLALYTIGTGQEWSQVMPDFSHCKMDENGRVYSSTKYGDNKIWNNNSTEIISWGTAGLNFLDVAHDGTRFLDAYTSYDAMIYEIDDVYTCYPDLYMQAYLEKIDTTTSATYDIYTFTLGNWNELPDELFVPSPELPAQGLNTQASRTYVRLKGDNGLLYNSYVAVYHTSFFDGFDVFINKTTAKPDNFYFELWDRKCDIYMNSTYMYADRGCPIGDLNGDCIVNLIDLGMMSQRWLFDNN